MKNFLVAVLSVCFLTCFLGAQKSPDEFFGKTIGADRTLIAYPEITRYFKYLEGDSPRIRVVDEGASTLGNQMILAFISSEENIRNLGDLIEINRKLANPDELSADQAKELVSRGRVFVIITAAIHATEIGASQMAMTFAHKWATTSDPEQKKILDQVVILLMPSINPDGNIMVCDWFNKYLGTPYEGGNMPFLYQTYSGHDNNRDYCMLNLKESQVLNAVLHHRYFPQVFLDMHQMGSDGPRIFVPPFEDPLNQNLSPVMIREVEIIGAAMALRLQERGKQGVANGYGFDAYWPGGTKNTAWYKNVVGLLSELASVRVATPVLVDRSDLRGGGKGLPEYKPQVNFPDPWDGGWWRLKDIIEYEEIVCDALVETAALHRNRFLGNFYRMGKENIEKGKSEAPYAYIVSPEQWDGPDSHTFIHKLMEGGVRVYRLEENWQSGSRLHSKGSVVIPLDQPYRPFIKAMMERQRYPEIRYMEDGPILEPYDNAGWTMPLLMNVRVAEAETVVPASILKPIEDRIYPVAPVTGEGDHYLLSGRVNRSFMAVNRLLKGGVKVQRVSEPGEFSPGDFIVAASGAEKAVEAAAVECAVPLRRVKVGPAVRLVPVRAPRMAIYQSYLPTADEGWTRWVLDHFGFPYTVVHNRELRQPDFSDKFDTLIFPNQNRSIIVDGKNTGDRPAPFLPPEYSGGIGKEGIEAVKKLVKTGGRLILLDGAFEIAQKDLELPVVDVAARAGNKLNCPGSLLEIELIPTDPLAWGMETKSILFFSNSAAFRVSSPADQSIRRHVSGRFKSAGPHLLSGYLSGGEALDNAVTTAWFEMDKGKVVLLGGRVQNRAQTFATFKLLFNAIWLF